MFLPKHPKIALLKKTPKTEATTTHSLTVGGSINVKTKGATIQEISISSFLTLAKRNSTKPPDTKATTVTVKT